ncbi:uncharacterized protein FFB14_00178 [Fusarium fujikuroi]|nr:uncharacterized protein FFB14_00178 [Fusarium fujikuroi]
MYFRHIIIALSLLGASCTLPTQDSVAMRGIAPRSLPKWSGMIVSRMQRLKWRSF